MRGLSRILWPATAVLVVAASVGRLATAWSNDTYLSQVAGIWLTLADDLAHGVLYRPLQGDLGYGGTRFLPLTFSLHALLMTLGLGPRVAGYAVAFLSVASLLAAAFVLMKRLGVPTRTAAGATAYLLAGEPVMFALMTFRGDALPAAFVLAGLAFGTAPVLAPASLAAAALFLVLAFGAKMTAVFGLGVAMLYRLALGRPREAWILGGVTLAGYAAVLVILQLGSGGRALGILQACGSGGMSAADLLAAPRRFLETLASPESQVASFFLLAAAALLALPFKEWRTPAPLLFATTLAATVFIYASPGTDFNLLIDLHAASIVLVAVFIARHSAEPASDLAGAALALAALLAVAPHPSSMRMLEGVPRRAHFERTLRAIGDDPRPILAENPALAIFRGERPYLFDPFMFRILREREPGFADALWRKLREQEFAAVVLIADPRSPRGAAWYTSTHFGPGFTEALEVGYEPAGQIGEQIVYRPRGIAE